MRGAKRSAKNTAKNISLLVLCGLDGRAVRGKLADGSEHCANARRQPHFAVCNDRFVGGAGGL